MYKRVHLELVINMKIVITAPDLSLAICRKVKHRKQATRELVIYLGPSAITSIMSDCVTPPNAALPCHSSGLNHFPFVSGFPEHIFVYKDRPFGGCEIHVIML